MYIHSYHCYLLGIQIANGILANRDSRLRFKCKSLYHPGAQDMQLASAKAMTSDRASCQVLKHRQCRKTFGPGIKLNIKIFRRADKYKATCKRKIKILNIYSFIYVVA